MIIGIVLYADLALYLKVMLGLAIIEDGMENRWIETRTGRFKEPMNMAQYEEVFNKLRNYERKKLRTERFKTIKNQESLLEYINYVTGRAPSKNTRLADGLQDTPLIKELERENKDRSGDIERSRRPLNTLSNQELRAEKRKVDNYNKRIEDELKRRKAKNKK